jgi:hypothetical protein
MFRLMDHKTDDEAMLDEFIAAERINDESRGEWIGGMIVATFAIAVVLIGVFVARM